MNNRQPMKGSCSDNPLTLRILAVSSLHIQYSPIAISKISNCMPQPQITLSKNFLPLKTNSTHPHTSLLAARGRFQGEPFHPWGHALFVLLKQFFNVDVYNS